MTNTILADHFFSDMVVRYRTNDEGQVGLELLPRTLVGKACGTKSYKIDSLIQVGLRGETFSSGWAAGLTMRNSSSTAALRLHDQIVESEGTTKTVTTILRHPNGLVAAHVLRSGEGAGFLEIFTRLSHEGTVPVTLEMVSSFSLGGLTPFREDEAFDTLKVHRLRSTWSAEGRRVTETVEDLQLEPSWLRHGVRVERFGQVGSMPVRKFFPFVAVEDTSTGVLWAAQVACPSSWQIELYRRDEALCLSGGLADFEFGHWAKTLQPGESFETPRALLTVGNGGFDEVCQRLLKSESEPLPRHAGKPFVLFNEFCTTWGKPSQETIGPILEALKAKGFSHFVIDAGWYADKAQGWNNNHGDWNLSQELFPDGLEKTVAMIRQAGMVPGIWFEIETCGDLTKAFQNTDHLLKRHGLPLTSGERRFWDMTDPWVMDYLSEKVIGFLRKYGFGYLKVDYNETIGVGCDGAESLGEGLRRQMLGTQAFLQKIRDELPGILIENCSSGGHRLEPSMMALCDFASFSDAHECQEIPIIAANLHRVIRPGQSQIWAVIRRDDPIKRIVYSMVNTFLGVPCVSGDVFEMTASQWSWVVRGMEFYRLLFPVLEQGTTEIFGPAVSSYRKPHGWQAVLRTGSDEAFALFHSFHGAWPARVEIPLGSEYAVAGIYGRDEGGVTLGFRSLKVDFCDEFEAVAVRLRKTT